MFAVKFVPTFLFFEICTAILSEAADRKRNWQRSGSALMAKDYFRMNKCGDGNCSP